MKVKVFLYLLFIGESVFSLPPFVSDEDNEVDEDEKRLLKKLFSRYDPEIRPVFKKKDTVRVKFGVSLFQIIEVDFKNQVIKMSTWTRQFWRNPFLSWNVSEFGGIKSLNVEAKKIWKPDIYLYNNVDDSDDGAMDKYRTKIVIFHDGLMKWLAPKIISSSCKFDVKYFPFDEQFCTLKFGSWTHDGFHLDIVPEEATADTKKYIRHGEWALVSMSALRGETTYHCCPEPYPDITYTLHIRRKSMFYFVNVIAPCTMISALTILSFYLPPESGERLGLVITNLLALMVFLLMVAGVIPATSDVVPLVSVYFYGSMFQIALALFATCFVLKCHFNNPSHTPLPSWMRVVILKWLAGLLRIDVRIDQDAKQKQSKPSLLKNEKMQHDQTFQFLGKTKAQNRTPDSFDARNRKISSIEETHNSHKNEAVMSAQSRSPRGLLTPEADASGFSSGNLSYTNLERATGLGLSRSLLLYDVNNYRETGPRETSDDYLLRSLLHSQESISRDVGGLAQLAHEHEEGEGKKEEWTLVAHIVDQFFLYVFVFGLIFFSLVVFMQAPNYVFE